MAKAWYVYNGSTNADAQYSAGNYRILSPDNKPACVNGTQICAIYANFTGTSPTLNPDILSLNIKQYIANGLATLVAQPQIPTDAKRHIYLKTILA
ncbi:hypothetical protein SAMN06265348_1185 [Pedobacter westerhofensis]|uniref:Uncharacterized protein n=1 Tax=Pedobacter westerhofensis TaxID=425512 RepID=A0A521FRZ6_9SPHI|nr:hypothetical protein [Pedobacter westerhofensis]SMO98854.1 hypothetical protein SAMN06265348_1185 [Pedobacter westerhofensis]